MDWLADDPPMCSVPECRETPGGLHHQKSKAQGAIVPSDPFLSWKAASMALGLLFFHSSLLSLFLKSIIAVHFLSYGFMLVKRLHDQNNSYKVKLEFAPYKAP